MNKSLHKVSSPDLEQVKTQFQTWRATRTGKQRIPQQLWQQILALLGNYSIAQISRELQLDYGLLKRRTAGSKADTDAHALPTFLEIKPQQLSASVAQLPLRPIVPSATDPTCTILIERTDGNRLTITIAADGQLLSNLCASLLRA